MREITRSRAFGAQSGQAAKVGVSAILSPSAPLENTDLETGWRTANEDEDVDDMDGKVVSDPGWVVDPPLPTMPSLSMETPSPL